MLYLWGFLAALVGIAGARHLIRLRAARGPERFWSESWDEPEEYGR